MKLSAYLKERKITHAAFGVRIGSTQAAVTRYANGKRKPNLTKAVLIERETEGAVTVADFVHETVDEASEPNPHPHTEGLRA